MNIIFSGFHDDVGEEVLTKLINALPINYCEVIKENYTLPNHIKGKVYSKYNIRDGLYSDVNWNKIKPVDKKILDDLVFYESIFLEQVGRMELYGYNIGNYRLRKDLYLKHVRFWNHILDEKEINLYISSNVPHTMGDYIIYALCKLKNIDTLFFYRLPIIPGVFYRLYTLENIEGHKSEIKTIINRLNLEYGSQNDDVILLENDLEKWLTLTRMGYKKNQQSKIKQQSIMKKLSKLIKKPNVYTKLLVENIKNVSKKLIGKHKTRRSKKLDVYYSENSNKCPDLNKKFIYLPLHYQPECTTSPLASHYVNQLLMIKLVSYILPNEYKIYVKEFPIQTDVFREYNYYKEIVDLPNVELISKKFSSLQLIENSKFVVTATGTAAFEAIVRGIPALVFGHTIYENAPGIFKVESFDDVERAVNIILSEKIDIKNKDIRIFLKALEEVTFRGYIEPYTNVLIEEDKTFSFDKNVENIVKAVLSSMEIKSKLKQV